MSAPGENAHLASIVSPTIGIVTSIALEHLEFMGSIEAIAAAEAELLPWVAPTGAIVVPVDEALLVPYLVDVRPRVWRVGPGADADVEVLEVEVGERTVATLRVPGGERLILRLRPFGLHNARNAAAAIAVGLAADLSPGPMVEALEAVEPVGDRGRVRAWGPHRLVADCYNANPGSVTAALHSLAAARTGDGPIAAVLGDMLELGPDELELHGDAGRLAAKLGVDLLIGVGERSRETVKAAARAGLRQAHEVGEDLHAAVELLQRGFVDASAGTLLIKGSRGMRLERLVELLVN
jgi:UDP-N-acetylmuramoyl-tripeptide--D-alanyl-D-alanine ligase